MRQTPEEYYSDAANHGDYQYVTLSDMVTNFILNYVGNDKLINNIHRDTILFHFKRGLSEFNYDVLKEVKVLSFDIGDALTLTLPYDYINYTRLSWLDTNGLLRPMIENRDSKIALEYLLDNEYNIVYDNNGYPITTETDGISVGLQGDVDTRLDDYISYPFYNEAREGGTYRLDTQLANVNGAFVINKKLGVIKFSSELSGRKIVLEYISDGLNYYESSEVSVNKLAEQALYDYCSWMILNTKIGIQEYVVNRARKTYHNSRKTAKMRLSGFQFDSLLQVLKGKSNWIK